MWTYGTFEDQQRWVRRTVQSIPNPPVPRVRRVTGRSR